MGSHDPGLRTPCPNLPQTCQIYLPIIPPTPLPLWKPQEAGWLLIQPTLSWRWVSPQVPRAEGLRMRDRSPEAAPDVGLSSATQQVLPLPGGVTQTQPLRGSSYEEMIH